jgi:hypothetical protein
MEYKDTIRNTTLDLEEHLKIIQERLQLLTTVAGPIFTLVQSNKQTATDVMAADRLKPYQGDLSHTRSLLNTQLKESRLHLSSNDSQSSSLKLERELNLDMIEAEIRSIDDCLAYLSQALARCNQDRTNIYGNITVGEDCEHIFVSTLGNFISARRITVGERATQFTGYMSDDSIQQVSRNRLLSLPISGERGVKKKVIEDEGDGTGLCRYVDGKKLGSDTP